MSISLKQLAIQSGFSINTVSRALRDEDDVKPETKQKIVAIAKKLGYVNNGVAKSLRTGKTNTIGVVSADSSNPFFAEVILGIEASARSHGYHILLTNTEESPAMEREAIDLLIGRQVDGLLIMPVCGKHSNVEYIKSLGVPYIIVGRWLPGIENHSVMSDEYEKAKQLTALFLANGHREIAHLAGPSFVSSSLDRLKGYRDAHAEANIPVREDLIIETDGHAEDGHKQINSLIRRERSFTALIAFNDLVALGAMRALKEAGIRVPKDVEVAGFDDLDYSRYLFLGLSSVQIPKKSMGRAAFEILRGHMLDQGAPYEKKTLESRIMLRETTLFERL